MQWVKPLRTIAVSHVSGSSVPIALLPTLLFANAPGKEAEDGKSAQAAATHM